MLGTRRFCHDLFQGIFKFMKMFKNAERNCFGPQCPHFVSELWAEEGQVPLADNGLVEADRNTLSLVVLLISSPIEVRSC